MTSTSPSKPSWQEVGFDFCAWDIEITKQLPDVEKLQREHDLAVQFNRGSNDDAEKVQSLQQELEKAKDWRNFAPLGVSCAGTHALPGDPRAWASTETAFGCHLPKMPLKDLSDLVHHLTEHQNSGRLVVTYNGLGFDFPVVAEEFQTGHLKRWVRDLALGHVDLAFQFFCERGFMPSLQNVALGLGLAGKTEGMSGAMAPVLWARSAADQQSVLEYVKQDVVATGQVVKEALTRSRVAWITKSGRPAKRPWHPSWHVREWGAVVRPGEGARYAEALGMKRRFLTVRECLELPLPDTSWMTEPWPRSKFAGWLEDVD